MNATRAALVSLCILAAAAGCSSGDKTPVASATSPSTSAAASVATTSTTAAPPSTSTTTTRPAAASPKARRVKAFETPSRNVACGAVESGWVRCDIRDAMAITYTAPSKPASCEFDWGLSFAIVADGSVEPLCVSDALDELTTTRAGETVLIGDSRCTVQTGSIRCVAEGTDGGLFLSPERYEIF